MRWDLKNGNKIIYKSVHLFSEPAGPQVLCWTQSLSGRNSQLRDRGRHMKKKKKKDGNKNNKVRTGGTKEEAVHAAGAEGQGEKRQGYEDSV